MFEAFTLRIACLGFSQNFSWLPSDSVDYWSGFSTVPGEIIVNSSSISKKGEAKK
jgi:hypothetical protein